MYLMFFIVPKKNAVIRAILNLKWLNKSIQGKTFKMEILQSILETIQKADFLASLDLSEAYLHILIRETHHIFLRLAYNGEHFLVQSTAF